MARKAIPLAGETKARAIELKENGVALTKIKQQLDQEFGKGQVASVPTIRKELESAGYEFKKGRNGNGNGNGKTKKPETTPEPPAPPEPVKEEPEPIEEEFEQTSSNEPEEELPEVEEGFPEEPGPMPTVKQARYEPLALQLRPNYFKDFIYNEPTVLILQKMLESNRLPNGLMFSGIRGIGKTSAARIFARTLNCEKYPAKEACGVCPSCVASLNGLHPDIREIDGASHGNIDDIRKILEEATLAPYLGRKKVFIIDEAHNLGRSQASWDALLKILEEPPPHITWVFCTTQKHKIPDVIKSRLVSFDLRGIPTGMLSGYLVDILSKLGIDDTDGVSDVIARTAKNSIRDALTFLEKAMPYCEEHGWTKKNINFILNVLDFEDIRNIMEALRSNNISSLWTIFERLLDDGMDPETIFNEGIVPMIDSLMARCLGSGCDNHEEYDIYISRLGSQRVRQMADVIIRRSNDFTLTTNKKLVLQSLALELAGV